MKQRLLALLCAFALVAALLPTAALADYDIYVNAKDNAGLNLREGPGTNYPTVRDYPIPMGTKLHITQDTTGSDGLTWGYTDYYGDAGWVCLKETARVGVPELTASNADVQPYLDILNSYNYDHSYLVDFDGDGRAELLTTHIQNPDYGECYYSVWQGSTPLVQDVDMGSAMAPTCSLHTRDGKTYLCSGNGLTFGNYYYFYTVRNGQWTQVAFFDDQSPDDAPDYRIDGVSIPQSEYDQKLASYQKILDLHPWADPEPHDVRPQLESQAAAALASASPQELLSSIAYYGDVNQCKMTAAQALAYAQLLREFDRQNRQELLQHNNGSDTYYEGNFGPFRIRTFAALFDTGAGVPALTASTVFADSGDGSASGKFPSYGYTRGPSTFDAHGVWEYVDGQIVEGPSDIRGWSVYPDHIDTWGMMATYALYEFKNGRILSNATISGPASGPGADDAYVNGVLMTGDQVDDYTESRGWQSNALCSSQGGNMTGDISGFQPVDAMITALESYALSTATPADILSQIPYYGDVSKCRLTSDQASEMAAFLDNWVPNRGSRSDTRALLADPDASGYPVLFLTTDYMWTLCAWQNGVLTQVFYGEGEGGFAAMDLYQNSQGQYKWAVEEGCMEYYSLIAYEFQKGTFLGERTNLTYHDIEYDDGSIPSETVVSHEVDMTGFERVSSYKEGISLSSMSSLLRSYAAANTVPTYPLFTDILGSGWEAEPVKVASAALSGEVVACYSLTDGMCYILIETADGHYQGLLLQASRQGGKVTWQVLRTDAEPAAEADLSALVNQFLTTPNITLDFNKLRDNLTAKELADYLKSLLADMTGKGPNDPAKSDLAAFIESSVAGLASGSVSGRDNRLTVDDKTVAALVSQGLDAQKQFTQVLDDNGVALGKTVTVLVRLLWQDSKLAQPCQVTFDPKLADALQNCTLQLLLGDNQHYIQLPADRLKTLIDRYGTVTVQIKQENSLYQVTFVDQNGAVINRLPVPVTLGLPASGVLDTVMVSYSGGSDNWGGQYNPADGVISFDAAYSGQYEVLENNVAIDDIATLSEESQAAIRFMVSRGYLDAVGGQFRPGDSLNRYEFTQALVGMFFALDRDLTASFPDVPAGSPYYPYVASAQAKDIVKGYADGTFSGQDPINREQVFALAARTLMDQKGYTTPANPDDYLSGFGDQAMISDWAREQLALAVREGVASRGSVILPQDNITREQAAVVLYRLFLLLYEVPPVALDLPQAAAQQTLTVAIVVAAAVAVAALTAAAVLIKKGKKAPK